MQLYFVSDKGNLIKINKFDFAEDEVYVVDDNKSIYVWIGGKASQNKRDAGLINARKLDKTKGGSAKILIMEQDSEYGAFLAMIEELREGIGLDGTFTKRPELTELQKDEEQYVKYYLIETLHNVIDDMKDPRYKFEDIPESFIEEQINAFGFRDVREVHWDRIKAQLEMKLQKALDDLRMEKMDELDEIPSVEEARVGLDDEIRISAYFLSRKGFTYDELCWLLAEKIVMGQKGSKEVTGKEIKPKAEEIYKSSCTYDELCWLNAEMDILIEKKYLTIE